MILVFGGTGTIGGAVLRDLAAHHAPVRAVARTPDGAAKLRRFTPDVVVADLADPVSFAPALQDVDHVFLATPASADQVRLETNLVDALAEFPGEPHLVKLAAMGYDAVPADQAIKFSANHARIVDRIRERGVRHTILAPSGFMTNLLSGAGSVRGEGVIYASAGDGGIGWVDPADVGAVAAHVLASPGHEDASYVVTGPEVLNHDEVAERFSRVLGREVRHVDVPPEQFAQNLDQAGLPRWTVEAITELNGVYRAHQAEIVTDEVEKATGRAPRPLEDWVEQHRTAFS